MNKLENKYVIVVPMVIVVVFLIIIIIIIIIILYMYMRFCGLVGSGLDHRSLPPEFEYRRWHI